MSSRSATMLSVKSWFQTSRQIDERFDSFEALYKKFHPYVRKTLFYLVGQSHLNDLTQEVFLKIWKSGNSFRNDSSLKTWVYRIAINTAYDFLRREKIVLQPIEAVSERGVAPDQDRLDLREIIHRGILQLPEKQRAAFVLFYQEGLSVEEVAQALEINVGTVKSRLAYGRKSIIDFFEKNGVRI